MSAKSDRAARMSRAANRGNPTAAGFPIVDAETLALRLREYEQAAKGLERARDQVEALRQHILKRALVLEGRGAGALEMLPREWLVPMQFACSAGDMAREFLSRASAE